MDKDVHEMRRSISLCNLQMAQQLPLLFPLIKPLTDLGLLCGDEKCAVRFTVAAAVIGHLIFPSSLRQQQ